MMTMSIGTFLKRRIERLQPLVILEMTLGAIGFYSYPLYLVHYPLVYFYVAWISNHKGVPLRQAWPYALAILLGGILMAYANLKWYDEPVRHWLRKQLG